jgi:hypothetical protein
MYSTPPEQCAPNNAIRRRNVAQSAWRFEVIGVRRSKRSAAEQLGFVGFLASERGIVIGGKIDIPAFVI